MFFNELSQQSYETSINSSNYIEIEAQRGSVSLPEVTQLVNVRSGIGFKSHVCRISKPIYIALIITQIFVIVFRDY